LGRAEGSRNILSIARKAKYGVKQAASGNYRKRRFVYRFRSKTIHPRD
jgi:hypothetical protein